MLSIDRAAGAVPPPAEDVAVWGSHIRVFVSSVTDGMADKRQAAADGIREVGATPLMFEAFGGRDADPEQASLAEVASSDIYLGILGRRYGRLLLSRRSATHEEYREAERLSLRISVWTSTAEDWTGDQQDFVNEVRLFHVTGSYRESAGRSQAQDPGPTPRTRRRGPLALGEVGKGARRRPHLPRPAGPR